MKILRVRALRGPNIWARSPVLEALVDLQHLKDSPSTSMPGFNDRLMAWLPSMIEHECSEEVRGGFFIRLREGTYLAHILEHTTIELQNLSGTPIGYGRARETSQEGIYKVAVKYVDETLGRACLQSAFDLLMAAVEDRPFDVAGEIGKLRALADKVCLGPSTLAIVHAAKARGIPHRRLNAGSLVQLGQGAKQRRIWTAETDRTSAIAESIAQDKELTKSMLRAAGVPVPEGRIVTSPADAWEAAKEIGVENGAAVVVKPRDANHARGVFVELTQRLAIESAYVEALKEGSGVLVEQFLRGAEHRLLVVGGKMVAACRGDAIYVTGDGLRKIRDLIEDQVNSDPRRGVEETFPLHPVRIDSSVLLVLERQGLTADSVPSAGTKVLVSRNDNLSRDVTDDVHPEVAERAVMAASAVGLDIAGLDIIAENIGRPLEEQGAAVVEVNSGPGLLMHLKPKIGSPRPVGEAILATLFAPEETGRIPIVCVTGTNGKTIVTRVVRHLLMGAGRRVGMTSSDGVYVANRRIEAGDCAGPRSARNVLLNPLVDAAVFECGRGGILREGMGFDFCDVAVVTNIGRADHLGQYYINTPAEMFKVKRCGVDVVLPTGFAVLNAADPLVVDMIPLSRGGVILFGVDPELPAIAELRAKGGRAVFVRDGSIVLATGSAEDPLLPLTDVPFTHCGVPFQMENALASAAAGWALNLSLDVIRDGLRSFQGDRNDAPGRFNVLSLRGGTVILDDCHNASALEALAAALASETFAGVSERGRSIVYAAPGDRRDVDILEMGRNLGRTFDRIVVYERAEPRGREPGEASVVLRQGIAESGRNPEVVGCGSWEAAVNAAVASQEPGSVLVVQAEEIEPAVKFFGEWQNAWSNSPATVSETAAS